MAAVHNRWRVFLRRRRRRRKNRRNWQCLWSCGIHAWTLRTRITTRWRSPPEPNTCKACKLSPRSTSFTGDRWRRQSFNLSYWVSGIWEIRMLILMGGVGKLWKKMQNLKEKENRRKKVGWRSVKVVNRRKGRQRWCLFRQFKTFWRFYSLTRKAI